MNASKQLVEAVARVVFPPPDPKRRRVVLCYHSVHPSAPYASVTPREFEAHLDWLTANCDIVPLEAIRHARPLQRPAVALTFDDGYADNRQHATPSLQQRGLTATFFLTVGLVEGSTPVVERMAELWSTQAGTIESLRWEDVAEMRAAGMRFGSHTYSHPNLAALDPAEADAELRDSKRVLEDRLQEAITSVAYPFGKSRHHVTDDTAARARACGYLLGVVTTSRGLASTDDDLQLPRIVVGDDTVDDLAAKVTGAIDWHAHVRDRLPRTLSQRSLSIRRSR
jgi:peptidoglycan/xylan/chitin deacetylase (PgdA/CDA1 family)